MRRAAAGLACAALLGASALAGGPAAAQTGGDGLIPEGHWTDEQVAQMLALIAETEDVLPARFPSNVTRSQLNTVLGGMGYFNFGVSAPGGYDHWINPGWFFDDHVIDPEYPESLVYQRNADGTWRLVSAMFMLDPAIDVDEIPEDIAWLPGWHGHPELCVNPNGTFAGVTDPENPNCPNGTTQATTPVMMHVWIEDNGVCDHRFGGVGVGGVHCDHGNHEDPGHEDPGHEDPGHEDPGHEDPGHEDPGHEDPGHEDPGHEDPGHEDPGHEDPGHEDPGHGHTPSPARPVTAAPDYAG
ncbi:MAG TPA: hypothetical protein VIL36_08455 [Acidimicrobiales bacterium]